MSQHKKHLGIDVSKNSFDLFIHETSVHKKSSMILTDIKQIIKWIKKQKPGRQDFLWKKATGRIEDDHLIVLRKGEEVGRLALKDVDTDGPLSIFDVSMGSNIYQFRTDAPEPLRREIRQALGIEQPSPKKTRAPDYEELSMTHEEWERFYLKELVAHSQKQTAAITLIKGWVMFFGIVAVVSILLWTIIILNSL